MKNPLKTILPLFGLATMVACNNTQHPDPAKISHTTFKPPVITTGTKKPVVIPLTSANAPVVIAAGAPVVEKDSLNGGAPFFTHFNTDNSLVSTAVNCMLEDRSGNIWIGTQGSGASRYDGRTVTNYTTAQGLTNTIICMMQDKAENIWFGTSGGGAICYNGKSFKSYTMAEGLGGNIVLGITGDKAGNIWITSQGGGLQCFDGKTIKNYTAAIGMGGNDVASVMQDKAGYLWIGKSHGGVCRFDGKHFKDFSATLGLTGLSVMCMLQDKKNNIWFGTARVGLKEYNGYDCVTWDKTGAIADDFVVSLLEDKRGDIWAATTTGLSRYDGKNWHIFNKKSGFPDGGPSQIIEDHDGDIWFVVSGNGISRFDGNKFINYGKAQGLTSNNVGIALLDHNGLIWLSYGADMSRYDGKAFTDFTPKRGQVGTFGHEIFQDRLGNIWFGTEGSGVLRYDGETFYNYNKAQGLASDYVYSMTQDRSGNIWFTTDNGASRYDGKTFTSYTPKQGLTNDNIYAAMQDKSGAMWFGTWGGGVTRFDGKTFTNYNTDQGLAFNIVDKMLQDSLGNIWFCTGKGVSKFDGQKFTNYNTEQGLAGNLVISRMLDHKGIVWFGTGTGVASRFSGNQMMNNLTIDDQSELLAISEDVPRKMNWFGTTRGLSWMSPTSSGTFDMSAGYPVKDVNALLIDKKGILWMECGNNKIIRFDYDKLDNHPAPLKLDITGIKINGSDICWNALLPQRDSLAMLNEMETTFGKILSAASLDTLRKTYSAIKIDSLQRFYPVPANLTLPYEDRNLTINYIAIAPDWPKRVKYSYRLTGYDKEWSVPSNNLSAVFGNIPEGKYTFNVKAITPYGVLGTAEYSFEVLPPWYRTWWAWLFYACLLIGSIWMIVRMRSGQLIRQKHVLENTVKVRTEEVSHQRDDLEKAFHELRATQAQLIQSEKMASLGQLTTGIAHEIQNPLNFVNNFSDVNAEMIEEMNEELHSGNIEEVFAILSDLRENEKKINHHGRRAQNIVKGMLEHGRAGGSAKDLTDLNKLVEEYLRLAYQQIQNKYPYFEAELIIETDPNLPQVELIPADIGRVFLNLYSNAFYAMNEKKENSGDDYKPLLKVTTIAKEKNLEVTIKDNGTGIPANIAEKIMNPFFTTKPTGDGVGMGLSLSYDILVNAYKGKLDFESKAGEGSTFSVILPL